MMFTSLKDMMVKRRLCPLCREPIFFGFQVTGGRAYIKYSQSTTDVFMNIDIERNWATCNQLQRTFRDQSAGAWDRPSFRGLTKSPGALTAACRSPVYFIDGELAGINEYSFTYDILLNRMKNRVETISVNLETYKILDGYEQYDIIMRYSMNEVEVTRISENTKRNQHDKYPIVYFQGMTIPSREGILRKVKTIQIMKEK